MTNKMPVVGQRYRHSELKANGVLSGWFMNQFIPFGIFDFDDGREMEVRGLALKNFFDVFEELPDSNQNFSNPALPEGRVCEEELSKSQEKEEVQVTQEQLPEIGKFYRRLDSTGAWECEDLELARSPNGPRFAIMKPFDGGFKERFNLRDGFWRHWELIPYAGAVVGQVNKTSLTVDLEKEEVNEIQINVGSTGWRGGGNAMPQDQLDKMNRDNEVERALGELKKELDVGDMFYHDLRPKVEKLVNALEAEKERKAIKEAGKILLDSQPRDTKSEVRLFTNPAHGVMDDFWKEKFLGNKPVETQKKSEIEDCLTCGLAFSRISTDAEGNIRKENVPFKNIYKEEEPKSIWKDVSELPEIHQGNENIEIILKSSGQDCSLTKLGDKTLEFKNLSKYCTLTDFVNHIEKQLRIANLKNILISDLIEKTERLQKDIEELKRK